MNPESTESESGDPVAGESSWKSVPIAVTRASHEGGTGKLSKLVSEEIAKAGPGKIFEGNAQEIVNLQIENIIPKREWEADMWVDKVRSFGDNTLKIIAKFLNFLNKKKEDWLSGKLQLNADLFQQLEREEFPQHLERDLSQQLPDGGQDTSESDESMAGRNLSYERYLFQALYNDELTTDLIPFVVMMVSMSNEKRQKQEEFFTLVRGAGGGSQVEGFRKLWTPKIREKLAGLSIEVDEDMKLALSELELAEEKNKKRHNNLTFHLGVIMAFSQAVEEGAKVEEEATVEAAGEAVAAEPAEEEEAAAKAAAGSGEAVAAEPAEPGLSKKISTFIFDHLSELIELFLIGEIDFSLVELEKLLEISARQLRNKIEGEGKIKEKLYEYWDQGKIEDLWKILQSQLIEDLSCF